MRFVPAKVRREKIQRRTRRLNVIFMKARPSEEKCREFVALQPTTTQLNCGASEAINKAIEKEKFLEVRV